MKTNNLKGWALVDKTFGDIIAYEYTREEARNTKRRDVDGDNLRIAKLKFEKFCR